MTQKKLKEIEIMYQDAIYIFVFSDIAKFTDFRLTHFSPVSHF